MKECDCNQMPHRATTVLGKPALQCSECWRVTVMWAAAERAHKWDRRFLLICLTYGIALWMMGTASAIIALRYNPDAMAFAAVVMTTLGIFGAKTWHYHWRKLVGGGDQ